jgi:hypothetical protein
MKTEKAIRGIEVKIAKAELSFHSTKSSDVGILYWSGFNTAGPMSARAAIRLACDLESIGIDTSVQRFTRAAWKWTQERPDVTGKDFDEHHARIEKRKAERRAWRGK